MIIGRPTLFFLGAIISAPHMKVKFPTAMGPGSLKSDNQASQICYSASISLAQTNPRKRKLYGNQKVVMESGSASKAARSEDTQIFVIEDLSGGPPETKESSKPSKIPRALPGEPVEQVELYEGDPSKLMAIGSNLGGPLRGKIIKLLREYADVFVWKPEDMPGLDESVAVHKLHIDLEKRSVKQKRRNFAPERQHAVDEEISKLLKANFIYEIQFPEWIANVVLVKKSSGKWRVCIDYTDLNRATPKDYYPLPTIDQLIDATAGNVLFSFLDVFSGYNQISLAPEDRPKTSFITHRAVYAYRVLPMGLMNAGATYQKAMNKIFSSQIGRNVEVYVDDVIVKSQQKEAHLADLGETFESLRASHLKLNPAKCTFGVASGKFLGHVISGRGIEANPEKRKDILDMLPPSTPKHIQSLNECLTSLRRFISKLSEKSLPFFEALKGVSKSKEIEWTSTCQQAFESLKVYLTSPPVLSRPVSGEPLYLYLAVAEEAVSSCLIREEDGKQLPIYYVSHVLRNAEVRYPMIEKVAYCLLLASRKLRPYFQGHDVNVYTNHPLRKILHKPDLSGRLVNWVVELSQFNISYLPRTAIKGQALADFLVECSIPLATKESGEPEAVPEIVPPPLDFVRGRIFHDRL